MSNVTVIEDPYMRALLLTCGKSNVKRFFNVNQTQPYRKIIDMACFLAANGIKDFGSNDNKRPKRVV